MKHALRAILTVLVLVFVGTLAWRALDRRQVSDSGAGQSAPQRQLTYVATPEGGPRFHLPAGAAVFRFVTFLHSDQATTPATYDPTKRVEYGLRFVVWEGDREVDHRDVWFVTRKGKAEPRDGRWMRESAYYPVGTEGEPYDPRLVDLDLRDLAGAGRQVEVRAIGQSDPVEVNVLAFTKFARSEARIDWLLRVRTPGEEHGADVVPGIDDWAEKTRLERRHELSHGWRRESSIVSVETRTLFSTSFRLELDDTIALGEQLTPGKAVAVNLRGPVQLRLAARWPGAKERSVKLGMLRTDGEALTVEERVHRLPAARSVSEFLERAADSDPVVEVAEGVHETVWIQADDEPLRLLVSITDAEGGAGEHPMLRSASGAVFVRPDFIEFPVWQVTSSPLRFVLSRDDMRAGDAVRVSLRRATEAPAAELRYAFDDGPERSMPNDGPPSPFETVTGKGEESVDVTDPVHHRIWIPPGARTLTIWSDSGPLHWLTLAVTRVNADRERVLRAPYAEPPQGLRWSYAPYRRDPWYTVAPQDADAVARRGGRWTVRAQARWVPDLDSELGVAAADQLRSSAMWEGPPPEPPPGPAAVLRPRGARSTTLLEPVPSGEWSDTHRARFTPGSSLSCNGERRTRFIIHGDPGATYTVTWNGQPVRRRLLRTRADAFAVGLSGRGVLGVDSDEPLELWTSCRPRDDYGDMWRVRRVYALSPGRPLRLPVEAEDDTWYVNAVVYGPRTGSIAVTLDGGEPARRAGVVEHLTTAMRTVEWEEVDDRARLVRNPSRGFAVVKTTVPIGGDLAPGVHELQLERRDDGARRVFVRFFRLRR